MKSLMHHNQKKGRGARFNRGGGSQKKQSSSLQCLKHFIQDRDKEVTKSILQAETDNYSSPFTAMLDPEMSYRLEDSDVMDSGANISVTSPEIVALHGLRIGKWPVLFKILYANNPNERTCAKTSQASQ